MKKLMTAVAAAAMAAGSTTLHAVTEADADAAIARAGEQLEAAAKAGHVWRLVDKATGGSSQNIDKLLKIAKDKREKGELAEAARIANRVADAAELGQQQAMSQKDAGPVYQ